MEEIIKIKKRNFRNGRYQAICMLPRNLGEYFVSVLVEPIAGKNVSPSDNNCGDFWKTS